MVAAAAAAKKQRREHIVDGFRVADATAPDRSRSLAEIGLTQDGELDELMRAGVICAGHERSTWYLNEAAFIALRDSQSRQALRIALAAVAALLAILIAVLSYRTSR